ncbi:hypothetical protein Tco_0000531 [Tanacetum coccineum]
MVGRVFYYSKKRAYLGLHHNRTALSKDVTELLCKLLVNYAHLSESSTVPWSEAVATAVTTLNRSLNLPSVPPTKNSRIDLFSRFDDDEVVPIPPVVPITPVNVPAAPAPENAIESFVTCRESELWNAEEKEMLTTAGIRRMLISCGPLLNLRPLVKWIPLQELRTSLDITKYSANVRRIVDDFSDVPPNKYSPRHNDSYINVLESAQDRDIGLGEADLETLPKRSL